jgi:thiamine biosynthesis lipoprotein
VRHEVEAIDAAASRFRPDSELAAVNAAAGAAVSVSDLMIEAVTTALRGARITDGLVDPTVGSAMRVLGYDRDFGSVAAEGPPLTVTVRPIPGWRLVWTDADSNTVRVPAGVELDLGATAKALCADRAATRAGALAGVGVLVSLGGDLAVAGPAPAGGWSVLVTDRTNDPDPATGQVVAVTTGGLATSGVTARRWGRGGRRLHHVVDPATGWPADGSWRTVSVAAASCVDANIASTAAIVVGAAAPAWLAERNLPARLVANDGRVTTVAGWPEGSDPVPA